jgi:hypothetical protein
MLRFQETIPNWEAALRLHFGRSESLFIKLFIRQLHLVLVILLSSLQLILGYSMLLNARRPSSNVR